MGHIGKMRQMLDLKPMPKDEALHEAVPEAERMKALLAADAAAVLDDDLDDEADWTPAAR